MNRRRTVHITLDQPLGARLITRDQELALPVTLRYTSDDPLAVQFVFPGCATLDGEPATWTFARTLLEEGLGAPSGVGAVHVWPCGPCHTIVELHAAQGVAMIRFDSAALHRFLLRSYTVTEPGGEFSGPALDRGLTALLDGV
ncbi:SsgA family sporulation/cell division regulator [Streptomyces sp. NEAU-NA10]|uniref:SsgA family sporulation/cell division regulator n=1 Tax=Streptomyces sp. NEAU-NA10 TaxID=3416050 RepID=UPI003CC5C73B